MATRVVQNDDIEFCFAVGNQRGRAFNPDGRRGHVMLEFTAPPQWGGFLTEQYGLKKLPLPHRCGAFYIYKRVSPESGWEEVLSHTQTSAPESAELDAQVEVTVESLRESQAIVTQRQQEVAQLAARGNHLQEQNSGAEASLQALRTEINACRALLASERERCAREIGQNEERLVRETASLDEMLRNRRAIAAAEEARIQAQIEANTMSAMKLLEPMSDLFRSQIEERKTHLKDLSMSLEDELGAAKQVSARRHELQLALTRNQQAHVALEESRLDQLDNLVSIPEGERPQTASDRIKDMLAEKGKEIKPMEVFNGIIGLFARKAAEAE